MIAEMSTETDMMAHFLYGVAKEYDMGNKGPAIAAKVVALPKMATKIALDAIQLHGGYGYSREFPVERLMRDNKPTKLELEQIGNDYDYCQDLLKDLKAKKA